MTSFPQLSNADIDNIHCLYRLHSPCPCSCGGAAAGCSSSSTRVRLVISYSRGISPGICHSGGHVFLVQKTLTRIAIAVGWTFNPKQNRKRPPIWMLVQNQFLILTVGDSLLLSSAYFVYGSLCKWE